MPQTPWWETSEGIREFRASLSTLSGLLDVEELIRAAIRRAVAEFGHVATCFWFPKRLVMWCAVRLISHATTGEYSSTVVPELRAMDALKRWETA